MSTEHDNDNDNDGVSQRSDFILPTARAVGAVGLSNEELNGPSVYFAGHSLGAVSHTAQALVQEEIAVWANRAVEGHFDHPHGRPWAKYMDSVHPLLANIVGAQESEVACMGSLTSNLHLLMNLFYKPTATRYKILCEANAFPSDEYAFSSQAEQHGLDPTTSVIRMRPRAGEYTLRVDDILEILEREGPTIALVLFPGVQYLTSQLFPIERITRAAQAQGCICGWDLAHAVGNVPLALHEWNVDFAVWCSYKYLNAGPGAIGGLFLHDKWADRTVPRNAGWWGHDPSTRFQMPTRFVPVRGAQGLQQSNPDILSAAALLGSLRVFGRVEGGMGAVRKRSVGLTGRLEERLRGSRFFVPLDVAAGEGKGEGESRLGEGRKIGFTIITPEEAEARGAQLSLRILSFSSSKAKEEEGKLASEGKGKGMGEVVEALAAGLRRRGVLGDERRPDVMRFAPVPLYCTFEDCERAVRALDEVLEEMEKEV